MEEVLIVLCVVMPSLKFVVFLLLEKKERQLTEIS